MTIDIEILARDLTARSTTLILGSGASIPSGAPSGIGLRDELGKHFKIPDFEQFSLSDLSTIIEMQRNRMELIHFIREKLAHLRPVGGLLSIPLYNWAGIFTTNYDDLVEKSYKNYSLPLDVYSSNYDFRAVGVANSQELFKIHGTIDKDTSEGHRSRMIITTTDYDQIAEYREILYSRLKDKLQSNDVLIVGQSLADPDLRKLIDEAQKIKSAGGAPGRITLFVYEHNENLALIFSARGLRVCFGGIDELLAQLAKVSPSKQLVFSIGNDVLDVSPSLHPSTFDASVLRSNQAGQLERMFNGRAASYADIIRGWTFSRDKASEAEALLASPGGKSLAIFIGVAGVGKSTISRQVLNRLMDRSINCWEHKGGFPLDSDGWHRVDAELAKRKQVGVLFIDDAHHHLRGINLLAERLGASAAGGLKLILATSKPHWNPRLKSPAIFSKGEIYEMSRLSNTEINSLLDLLDSNGEIGALVEDAFLGFSRVQRYARLSERCNADMFVCLKNIFGFQSIDTIILAEFASLLVDLQSIYRIVAGMQAIGVRVHRELVRRATGLEASRVNSTLDDLDGIIEEYTVSEPLGIYGWKVRHEVISQIVSKYKYSTQEELYELFDRVISLINPSYRLEVQSLIDMCDLEFGITRIVDQRKQNVLLRKMISLAPSERVPRHRLIYNLIDLHQFDTAEAEIRVFEKDLPNDGPLIRYKARLKVGIAKYTDGILDRDRAAMIAEAAGSIQLSISRHPDDKNMYRVYLECGVEYYRYCSDSQIFERAMSGAKDALERILDPELRQIISRFARTGEQMGLGVI